MRPTSWAPVWTGEQLARMLCRQGASLSVATQKPCCWRGTSFPPGRRLHEVRACNYYKPLSTQKQTRDAMNTKATDLHMLRLVTSQEACVAHSRSWAFQSSAALAAVSFSQGALALSARLRMRDCTCDLFRTRSSEVSLGKCPRNVPEGSGNPEQVPSLAKLQPATSQTLPTKPPQPQTIMFGTVPTKSLL